METEQKPTSTKTNSLQEMLEERAEAKLTADIQKLSEVFNHPLLGGWNERITLTFKESDDKETTDSIQRLFAAEGNTYHWGAVAKFLLKEKLEGYITSETEAFVNRVNQLSQDVEDLKQGIEGDY